MADIATRIAAEDRLPFWMARIYSELDAGTVVAAIDQGRVRSLPPSSNLTPETVRALLAHRRPDPRHYDVALQCYGANAVLGPLDDSTGAAREVGLLFKVRAPSQQTATVIARTASPLLLHLPLPGMDHLPSFAFATSSAEIERGPSYEFVLNHVLDLEPGTGLFRIDLSEVAHA